MTAQTFTPAVDTTFLPKTNGLVFFERLRARSDKGRVFGLAKAEPPLPPDVQIIEQPTPITLNAGQRGTLSVRAIGNYDISYQWQYNAGDGTYRNATSENIAQNFPGAEYILVEGDKSASLQLVWISGDAPEQFRCRVRDTDPDANQSQVFTNITSVIYRAPIN